jgi:putative flavoprotein involved in K+ transport
LTGVGGGQDMDVRRLGASGVTLLPRLAGISDGVAHFSGDVEERLRHADEAAVDYANAVDVFIERAGKGIARGTERALEMRSFSPPAVDRLDLAAADVRTILWCTGYALDFAWVQLPILDEQGMPRQRRGVSPCDGIYFLGLNWMSKYKSSTLWGMGEDAEYIAEHIRLA